MSCYSLHYYEFLIDRSGSMWWADGKFPLFGRSRLASAVQVVEQVLKDRKKCPSAARSTFVGFTLFNEGRVKIQDRSIWERLQDVDPEKKMEKLRKFKASGETSIWDALEESVQKLDQIPNTVSKHLILLTDGLDNSSSVANKTKFREMQKCLSEKTPRLNVMVINFGGDPGVAKTACDLGAQYYTYDGVEETVEFIKGNMAQSQNVPVYHSLLMSNHRNELGSVPLRSSLGDSLCSSTSMAPATLLEESRRSLHSSIRSSRETQHQITASHISRVLPTVPPSITDFSSSNANARRPSAYSVEPDCSSPSLAETWVDMSLISSQELSRKNAILGISPYSSELLSSVRIPAHPLENGKNDKVILVTDDH